MSGKCINGGTDTVYKCLTCKESVCNKSDNCSVFAPETTKGWKAGSCVANCLKCKGSARGLINGAISFRKEKTVKTKATCNRNYLDLSKRVELIAFHNKPPKLGVRKLAERFGCGRSQVSSIIKSDKQIMAEWESNEGRSSKKRDRQQKFSQVNDCLCKWYVLCRNSNIPVYCNCNCNCNCKIGNT